MTRARRAFAWFADAIACGAFMTFVVVAAGCERAADPPTASARPAMDDDVVRAPLVDPAEPLEQARRAAGIAVAEGDLDGALKILDTALGGVTPVVQPGVPASAVARARCDRAAVLSRRAATAVDVAVRERDLRAALVDCDDDGHGPLLREALGNALVVRARALGDGADTRRARRALLEESLSFQKTAPAAVDLAVVCEADDDLDAALAAAELAVTLVPDDAADKPRVIALRDRLKRHATVEGGFKSASERHFIARFEGASEERLAWTALDQLEKAWFTVGQQLDLYPPDAITVVVYTGDQYRQATATPDWSAGAFDGKIRVREGLLAAERGTLTDTLVHEYVHAALHACVPSTSIPAWFNEGLAQQLEPSNHDALALLSRTGKADLQRLQGTSFITMQQGDADAAYATSRAMVQTLVDRRGVYGVRQLVAGLKDGTPFDDALQTSFALTPQQVWALLP